jgi:hypothetical protein
MTFTYGSNFELPFRWIDYLPLSLALPAKLRYELDVY